MSKNIYQMWARYKIHDSIEIISDLHVYLSEKTMYEHENDFKIRLKNKYSAKEIIDTGYDILFLEED